MIKGVLGRRKREGYLAQDANCFVAETVGTVLKGIIIYNIIISIIIIYIICLLYYFLYYFLFIYYYFIIIIIYI